MDGMRTAVMLPFLISDRAFDGRTAGGWSVMMARRCWAVVLSGGGWAALSMGLIVLGRGIVLVIVVGGAGDGVCFVVTTCAMRREILPSPQARQRHRRPGS